MIVYCAISKTTGKKYVGRTINTLEVRISGHFYAAKSNSGRSFFANEIRKLGIDDFEWVVLENCEDHNHMVKREAYWILENDCVYPKGYNSNHGEDHSRWPPVPLKTRSVFIEVVDSSSGVAYENSYVAGLAVNANPYGIVKSARISNRPYYCVGKKWFFKKTWDQMTESQKIKWLSRDKED